MGRTLTRRGRASQRWASGYFLHVFFILLLADLAWPFVHDPRFLPWSVYPSGLAFFTFALAMSVLVVRLLRKLLGKNSRLLIGSQSKTTAPKS